MNYGMRLGIFYQKRNQQHCGRPIIPFRKVLDGILYILRTGCQWKMLPSEFGSGSTCHRRFQEWNKLGCFQKDMGQIIKII